MSWTSVHSFLGTLSITSNPLNLFVTSTVYHKGFDLGHTWWPSYFPYSLLFKSEFWNKEFMIWAIVSSWSCFCWLYRASPSLAANNIMSDFSVDHLEMAICKVVSCCVGQGYLLWPMNSLGKTLLAFPPLHFVLQAQTSLTPGISWEPTLHFSPLWWKVYLLGVNPRRSCRFL